MVSLDARAVEMDDVTLVTATLEGGAVPIRVTLRNRLDGPVWPPRRMGVPVEGWDETGYVGVVPADERIAIGYACPASVVDPPLEIGSRERAGTPDGDFDSSTAVLRGLGSPAPPREALPLPTSDAADGHEARATAPSSTAERSEDHRPDDGITVDGEESRPSDDDPSEASAPLVGADDSDRVEVTEPTIDADVPDAVAAWLYRVEGRLERAEALAEASDVPSATRALRAVGSLEAASALEERREADVECLREITRRANALADRADRAAIPIETLDHLA